MNWVVKYLPEVIKDIKELNGSVRTQIVKGIQKVSQNPLPQSRGGFGKPLGNKEGNNLTGLYKIKFRGIGIRAVYALEEKAGIMTLIIVSLRDDSMVYKDASKRRKKYEL